jgi:hypothetical protein
MHCLRYMLVNQIADFCGWPKSLGHGLVEIAAGIQPRNRACRRMASPRYPPSCRGAIIANQAWQGPERQTVVQNRQVEGAVYLGEMNDHFQPFEQSMPPVFSTRARPVKDLGCIRIDQHDVGQARNGLIFLKLAKHIEVACRGRQHLHHKEWGTGGCRVFVEVGAIDAHVGPADIAVGNANRDIRGETSAFFATKLGMQRGKSIQDNQIMPLLRASHGDRNAIDKLVALLLSQSPLQELRRRHSCCRSFAHPGLLRA